MSISKTIHHCVHPFQMCSSSCRLCLYWHHFLPCVPSQKPFSLPRICLVFSPLHYIDCQILTLLSSECLSYLISPSPGLVSCLLDSHSPLLSNSVSVSNFILSSVQHLHCCWSELSPKKPVLLMSLSGTTCFNNSLPSPCSSSNLNVHIIRSGVSL